MLIVWRIKYQWVILKPLLKVADWHCKEKKWGDGALWLNSSRLNWYTVGCKFLLWGQLGWRYSHAFQSTHIHTPNKHQDLGTTDEAQSNLAAAARREEKSWLIQIEWLRYRTVILLKILFFTYTTYFSEEVHGTWLSTLTFWYAVLLLNFLALWLLRDPVFWFLHFYPSGRGIWQRAPMSFPI